MMLTRRKLVILVALSLCGVGFALFVKRIGTSISAASLISAGMTYDEVKALLGDPHYIVPRYCVYEGPKVCQWACADGICEITYDFSEADKVQSSVAKRDDSVFTSVWRLLRWSSGHQP